MTPIAIATPRHRWFRAGLAIMVVSVLALGMAACGRSHVVREQGASTRASVPKPGATARVKRGDTLYRIAVDNGISPLDLAMWNGIAPPYTIYPGQRLKLYPASGTSRATTAARPAATQPATSASRPPVRPTQARPQPVTPAPATASLAWRWPTDGQIVGRYVAGDPTRQGIDIAGNAGQPVRAAADGVVVYSGSGLVGYGELIIVKHDEQWLTAYGHNRVRLASEGTRVKADQQIAEMGRSGASRDMLHFEIRYNGKPVDPMRYLPAR